MNIYLPIAELSANVYYLLAMGGIAGLLAGLFGVGGMMPIRYTQGMVSGIVRIVLYCV